MTTENIHEYVEAHKDEAIVGLKEMLQTPSPTGQEMAVSKVAVRLLEQDGLIPEIVAMDPSRPNVYLTWKGPNEGPRFLFNGHYDVFPPASEWTRDPWSAEIKDGNIYACGSVDMKAGLTAGIMAVKFLKRSGFVPRGTVLLSCDCDEEQGGSYGAKYLISKGLLNADFGVCMEASERYVITDSDGRIAYRVTYTAESWHAGMRASHMDALQKAQLAIAALYRYDEKLRKERYFGDLEGGAILSVTEISAGNGGNTSNIHPAGCSFSIDRRYTRGETIESATNELRDVLDALHRENNEMNYELETLIASPQLKMDEDSPCVKAAIDAYEQFFHEKIVPGRRCGGGDTAKITEAYGFPLPQFGPGKFDQLCTENEHVSLQEYLNFIKAYMYMVVRLLS